MVLPFSILFFFTIVAFVVFSFIYWRDATREGFSSDQIFDSIFLMILGAFIGGKFLFRELSLDFLRYQFLSAPLVLEGVLLGGGLAAFIVTKKYKWDGWKIGDMIAPGLAFFQSFVFIGFWLSNYYIFYLYIAVAFLSLFLLINFLKNRRFLGNSLVFFQLKKSNRQIFTGGLLAVYLTGSSAIAILFLTTHFNLSSKFWWFQLIFYFLIFTGSIILFRKQLRIQNLSMAQLSKDFINKMKARLLGRKKEVVAELKDLKKTDPFIQEYQDEGSRNLDESGDEAADFTQHEVNQAEIRSLNDELKEIEESLKDIDADSYGVSKKTGKPIPEKRLEANPWAKTNVDEEDEE